MGEVWIDVAGSTKLNGGIRFYYYREKWFYHWNEKCQDQLNCY